MRNGEFKFRGDHREGSGGPRKLQKKDM